MSQFNDDEELAKFKAELPGRRAALQSTKNAFAAREEREVFQCIAATMTREERAQVAAELKAESRLLLQKMEHQQKEIERLEVRARKERVETEIARSLPDAFRAEQPASDAASRTLSAERAEAVARLKAESAVIKNLLEQREQRLEDLKQLSHQAPQRQD